LYSSYSASTSFTVTSNTATKNKPPQAPARDGRNLKAEEVAVLTAVRLVGEFGKLAEGEASAGTAAGAGVECGQQPGRALLEAPRGREQGRVQHGEHREQRPARELPQRQRALGPLPRNNRIRLRPEMARADRRGEWSLDRTRAFEELEESMCAVAGGEPSTDGWHVTLRRSGGGLARRLAELTS
jgi:hypothetical protein